MGHAIARAAWRRGAHVRLVSGPSSLEPPFGVEHVPVETARDMHLAVVDGVPAADVSIFAAAVSDFRPVDPVEQKLKRDASGGELTVVMTANPDIAAETVALRKLGGIAVGFALETADLLANARRKIEAKSFDLLVANDATEEGAGFDTDTNRVTILARDGSQESLPLMSKNDVAEEILDRVDPLLPSPILDD
jgi:phosphopantothenoylcysteine decarboxylase/phosphopantothenate--cysteine ligase